MKPQTARKSSTGMEADIHFSKNRNGMTMIAAKICVKSMFYYNVTRGGL